MLFANHKVNRRRVWIEINGFEIERKKILGILMDDRLSWISQFKLAIQGFKIYCSNKQR